MAGDHGQGKDGAPPLQSLVASLGAAKTRGPAPVESWHPPFCGDIDMRIAGDGTWFYNGTPIARPALVRLFSTILRKDPERFVLVTPAECVGITVEDAPFLAVTMAEEDGTLVIGTNVGDEVRVGSDHPLRFAGGGAGGVKPYVHVRGGLWAKLTRALALELLDRAHPLADEGGAERFGVSSGGLAFPITPGDLEP